MVLSLAQFDNLAGQVSKMHGSATYEGLTIDLLRSFPKGEGVKDKSDWAAAAANILTTTPSNRIRNAAALALADLGAVECSGRIVEALHRPDIAKASGTLLYALNELGASIPLSVFVGLIENGSFESRAAALTFTDGNRIEPSNDADIDDALTRLSRLATDKDDPEGAEAAQIALEHFHGNQKPPAERSDYSDPVE